MLTPSTERPSPARIAEHIVDGILAGRLRPGQHLGEHALATLFGVSRTLVREALARLSARGFVDVSARRGWFVVQPSAEQARQALGARVAIETGLLHCLPAPLPAAAIDRLRAHVQAEEAALRTADAGERSFLLGDFHVCLAECAGNPLLAEILRDLTARTMLIAAMVQSTHDATHSCDDHARIVSALARADHARAVALMRAHLEDVALRLADPTPPRGALDALRDALSPGSARQPS